MEPALPVKDRKLVWMLTAAPTTASVMGIFFFMWGTAAFVSGAPGSYLGYFSVGALLVAINVGLAWTVARGLVSLRERVYRVPIRY